MLLASRSVTDKIKVSKFAKAAWLSAALTITVMSKRRAEREAMFRFGGQSGVGAYSLRSTTNQ